MYNTQYIGEYCQMVYVYFTTYVYTYMKFPLRYK